MPGNELRADPGTGSTLQDQAPGKVTDPRSHATVALVPVSMAIRVAAEANRIDAERRDRECHCPGRAYVVHAWDLGTHKTGCRSGDAWLSVDEARAVLQTLPRHMLAALSRAIGGAA
jgi:hypothetical protein